MWKRIYGKIKKATVDRISVTAALVIGSALGWIASFLFSSVVFTITASQRLDKVEAATTSIQTMQSDISIIKTEVNDLYNFVKR